MLHRRPPEHDALTEAEYRLIPPLLCQALERSIAADRRRQLHAAALTHVREHALDDAARLARHAAGAGVATTAAEAFLRLAEAARAAHRYVAAEQHYSAALAHIPAEREHRPQMARALAGRGSVHYRLQRFPDALADIRRAGALASEMGDEPARLAHLLEEAKVLHWCQDGAEAEVTGRACAGIALLATRPGGHEHARLAAGSDLARARLCYQREELSPAMDLLERAASAAKAAGDYDTQVGALLLLGPAMVYSGQLAGAETCFAAVIDLCREAGDSFYLATAYLNRPGMWIKRGLVQPATDDLEQCIALAEDLGNAQLERAASFNLAELLYWHGRLDRARELAERSRALVLQYLRTYRPYQEALLLARIACACADTAVDTHLRWIEHNCEALPPAAETLMDMARLGAATLSGTDADDESWRALATRAADSALLEEHVEVQVVAAEIMCSRGREQHARAWLERARAAAGDSPLWQPRLARMARLLD